MPERTNAEAVKAWSSVPQELVEGSGEDGDFTRRYLLNPGGHSCENKNLNQKKEEEKRPLSL